MDGIKMEDFMDVMYKCKFCPYTCTQSSDMSSHVREKHLPSSPVDVSNRASEDLELLGTQSVSGGSTSTASTGIPSILVSNSYSIPGNTGSDGNFVNMPANNNFSIQVSDDVLSFNSDSQAYLDKGLAAATFVPLAVPVSQGGPLTFSNTSTPDLTELINLVKPADDSTGGSSQIAVATSDDQLSMESVVQLQSISSSQAHSIIGTGTAVASTELPGLTNNSHPYTVMAIHLPGLCDANPVNNPQYVVSTSSIQEPVHIPENADTKEFLLCGLCKLAFTTMESCQAHMQSEHKELMQGTGVSIGVQVGGAKRGRKKKSEMQPKVKMEPYLDPEDLEWLPSVSEGNNTTHLDGRVRRKVRPPRALKEDYVLGKRMRKRLYKVRVNNGFRIVCPMMSCKAKFKTNEGLKIHLSCHNLQDTAFTCNECETPHEFWKHLRLHLWRLHQVDVDLLVCEVCNYKTDTAHKMSVHKEIHTDTKPYACDVCGKGFRQASQMKNHQIIHTSQEGKEASGHWFSSKKCDVCERVFANSKCLKKHKEAVHGSLKPFHCLYCNHSTARKAMMQLHLRTHTGEKPFKCDICSYTTGDHNSMRRHKMRHTGQKQYRCTLCAYTCIQSISLKQHMRHKHPGTAGGIFQCSRCPFRTINQTFYNNHMQDHKKGLIPDKIEPPKTKKVIAKSQVEQMMVKHPQFHAVLPGEEPVPVASVCRDAITTAMASSNTKVFNMQVTMLPEGDTQVNAEDMARLSQSPGLMASRVSPLQLIYATLSTISEQSDLAKLEEGRSSLLTAELVGGIHTAVLSSMQDGVTVHSITYHMPVTAEENMAKVDDVSVALKDDLLDGKRDKASGSGASVTGDEVVNKTEAGVRVENEMELTLQTVSTNGVMASVKTEGLFLVGEGDVDVVGEVIGSVGEDGNFVSDGDKKTCRDEIAAQIPVSSTLREMLELNDKAPCVDRTCDDVKFIPMNFMETGVETNVGQALLVSAESSSHNI